MYRIKFARMIALTGLLTAALVAGVLSSQLFAQDDGGPETFTVVAGMYGPANSDVLQFFPQNTQVHRGDTVSWTFNGFHNVHFASAPIDLIIAPEVNGAPLPQVNPAAWFASIESGAAYTGGDANSGLELEGPSFSLVMDVEPGIYSYVCDVHPGMAGVIEVVADNAAIPGPEATMELVGAQFVEAGEALFASLPEDSAGQDALYFQVSDGNGAQITAGAGVGLSTINLYTPSTTVITAGESVTWTTSPNTPEPHTITWPQTAPELQAEEAFFMPIEQEGGPPMLSLGVWWTGTTPSGASVNPGDAFHSGLIFPGASFTLTFPEAGVFPYVCNLHPGMQGSVVVRPAA